MNSQSSCLSLSVRIPIAWPSSLAKRFNDIGGYIVDHSLFCVIIRCYSGFVYFISRIVQMLNIFAILRRLLLRGLLVSRTSCLKGSPSGNRTVLIELVDFMT